MKSVSILAVVFSCALSLATADTIYLIDESQLIGTITSITESDILIKTSLGLLTIPKDRIRAIEVPPDFDFAVRGSGGMVSDEEIEAAGSRSDEERGSFGNLRFEGYTALTIDFFNTFEANLLLGIRFRILDYLAVSGYYEKSVLNGLSMMGGLNLEAGVPLIFRAVTWNPTITIGGTVGSLLVKTTIDDPITYEETKIEDRMLAYGLKLSLTPAYLIFGGFGISFAEFSFVRNFAVPDLDDLGAYYLEINCIQASFRF